MKRFESTLTSSTDIPLGHTYLERKKAINAWDFECACDMCTAPIEERNRSDARRSRLEEIYNELQLYSKEEKYMDERVEELTYLIEKEEIWSLFCEYYMVVARAYMDFGKLEKARHYANIAEKVWLAYGGQNHDGVDRMVELWKDLSQREQATKSKAWRL